LIGIGCYCWLLRLQGDTDTLILDSNRIVGVTFSQSLPLSLCAGAGRHVIVGNTMLNENADVAFCLYDQPFPTPSAGTGALASAAAVTGNVLRGSAVLPDRNLVPAAPAPMDGWAFFNSIT